jgi:type II secretory pathway component PulM
VNVWIERLRSAFSDLSGRERALVSTAGGVVALLVVWFGLVVPALDASAGVAIRVERAERDLELIRRMRVEYDELQQRLASVEQRIQAGSRGSLRTRLESMAATASVNVDSMEPQVTPASDRYKETKMEVTLKQVDLPRTVRYLHEIESTSDLLSVKSLRVRIRPDKSGLLDVTFTVSSFEPL